jgi:hypothetical protein
MAIYRYRKIDENNLVAWEKNQLWFSPVDKLDDAFEMWCNFDSIGFSAYNAQTQQGVNGFLSDYKDRKIKTSTFCCFSKRPDIPLMWAQYSDGLSGVCIEYDETVLELNGKRLMEDETHVVDYSPSADIPFCDIYACHVNDNNGQVDNAYALAFKTLFLTKSKDWSYQEEIRLLWENPAGLSGTPTSQGIPFNKEAIKSIVFGERADPKKVKLIKCIFGKSMTYKTAKRSKTHYKIEIV